MVAEKRGITEKPLTNLDFKQFCSKFKATDTKYMQKISVPKIVPLPVSLKNKSWQ